jgi:hypothetical protein
MASCLQASIRRLKRSDGGPAGSNEATCPRLKLHTIEPRPSARTPAMKAVIRNVLLMLSGALAGCAISPTAPTSSLDVRATCQELTQASASKPELISKDYFANCMIAHGHGANP